MRKTRISFLSGVVLGLAGLLSASAQAPPSESEPAPVETYEGFIAALNAHEARMAQLQDQFRATLPIVGPLNQYQLELLAQLEAPQPAAIANSSANCIRSGGRSIVLTTVLDKNNEVRTQARDTETITARTGWKFEKPTASGDVHEISFDPGLSDAGKTATADFEDRYGVGQQAPHGHIGSGRYYLTCYNNNGKRYYQSWSWRLFRDCPH